MISFKDYKILHEETLEESREVVNHLTHIEDWIIDRGVKGYNQAYSVLDNMAYVLQGKSTSKVRATRKVDGAPSIFAGIDPTDGKFFVAKKGIFNKNPKVYKTQAEVMADTSGDLASKLSDALKYLPALGITGILQGDFMFSRADIQKKTIDGVEYVCMHPNTIVYAVPADSEAGKNILKAKIGIIWHTRYTGRSFDTMKAEGGTSIVSGLNWSKNVWCIDTQLNDFSGNVSFTQSETAEIYGLLTELKTRRQAIPNDVLNHVARNPKLGSIINIFNNGIIRDNKDFPSDPTSALFAFINERFSKEMASKKTDAAKQTVEERKREVLGILNNSNLKALYDVMNLIVQIKMLIIKKLNTIGSLKTFLKTTAGNIRRTGQEGFVITDRLGANAVKLVDRREFSQANFSGEYAKGWQK